MYDREEHDIMFDSYNSSLIHGNDTFEKKEAELAKRWVSILFIDIFLVVLHIGILLFF